MNISHLFPDNVDLVLETPGAWGEASVSVEKNVSCRIEYGNRLVRNAEGEQVVSFALIFFSPKQIIKQTTKIRIPGDSYDHPIIKIAKPKDMKNEHHQEVDIR